MPEKKEKKFTHPHADKFPEGAKEHARAARSEMRESIKALFPPEFIEHRRAAHKEMLLAAQELINHAIARVEEKD
jgi:hypothetical protein